MNFRVRLPDSERVQAATVDKIAARLVPTSPTRAMCELSLRTALRAGAIAPAVMAGLLLELHDGVVSHALDEARSIAFRHGGLTSVVDELEAIQREERGE